MATIHKGHFSGGACLTADEGNSTRPGLAEILQDVATDLDGLSDLKIPTIVAADATDLPTALVLLNEIKTKLNAIPAVTITTVNA